MSMKRINHPSELVSVNDIVTVYVYEIDEAKGRVSLSLLPLDQLASRNADKKEWKNRKKAKNRPERRPEPKKEEPIDEEEAMKRLLERFGKKY